MKEIILNFERELRFTLHGEPRTEFRVVAIVCSAIALGLGSLSHWVGKWYFNEAEGTPVERLGAAYYFWMASFAVLLVGMARVRIARRGETGGRS